MKDENERVRKTAAKALRTIGVERAVEPLIQALKDKDAFVRQYAAEALRIIGDERAVEPLIQVLKDENGQVREKAVEALGRIGDEKAVEPLLQAILDEKVHIVDTAKVLERMGCGFGSLMGELEEIKRIIDELREDRAAGVDAWMGEDPEDEYHILKDKLEFAATVALGRMGNERAVDPLIRALEDEDRYDEAIWGLVKIRNERTIEPLIRALKYEGDWHILSQLKADRVRLDAAETLAKIGKPAVKPLIEALKDGAEDVAVRMKAAEVLGEIGDERAVEPLIQALKDKDEFVRQCAAEALGEIGDERAVETLNQALKDEWVREEAAKALKKIG